MNVAKKGKSASDRKHHARVALLPCLVCGSWPVDVHHVVGLADAPGRLPKRHDRVVPLCKRHHDVQHGPRDSVHALGHQGFFKAYNIDLIVPALEALFNASFLPRDIYLISRMPSEPLASDIMPVAVISLVLAFVATLYPSWRASQVNPAEALRYE